MNTRGRIQRCFSHIYIPKIRIEICSPDIYSREYSAHNYIHKKTNPNIHFKFLKDQRKLNGGNPIRRSESIYYLIKCWPRPIQNGIAMLRSAVCVTQDPNPKPKPQNSVQRHIKYQSRQSHSSQGNTLQYPNYIHICNFPFSILTHHIHHKSQSINKLHYFQISSTVYLLAIFRQVGR